MGLHRSLVAKKGPMRRGQRPLNLWQRPVETVAETLVEAVAETLVEVPAESKVLLLNSN